jgi:hypothetical protein
MFSTINLTSGFWQMLLPSKSHQYIAFTISSMGQFQWVTMPMGLLGHPGSFQCLVETVIAGLANIIMYINNLLLYSSTHGEHAQQLDILLQRIISHNIKISPKNVFSEAPMSCTSDSN